MSIIQVALDLPPEIQKGLLEGTLVRYGGVIRNASGQIVKHLQDAPLPKVSATASPPIKAPVPKATSGLQKVGQFVKKNKNPIIIISVVAIAVTTAAIVYVKKRNKDDNETDVPDFFERFDTAFSKYITCIKNGTMTESIINELLASISELEKNKEAGNVTITIPIDNSELLMGLIKGYTEKLATVNNYSYDLSCDSTDELQLLKHYLNIQINVFRHAS